MSCRESRRARIDELFHEYEADITKLTQINERFQYTTRILAYPSHKYSNFYVEFFIKKRNVEDIEAYKSEITSLEKTVKILRSQNESLRQEISKKSPVSRSLFWYHVILSSRQNLVDIWSQKPSTTPRKLKN